MTDFPTIQSNLAGAIPVYTGDPATGFYLKPNADGSINTSGGGSSLVGVKGADGSTIATPDNPLPVQPEGIEYETVAAGQTAQVLGATGATGDYLAVLIITPAVAACGVVTLLDNATSIPIFAGGGTTALPTLAPIIVPFGIKSVSGAWKITTGASVSVVAIGQFT